MVHHDTKRIRMTVAGALGSAIALMASAQATAAPGKPAPSPHPSPKAGTHSRTGSSSRHGARGADAAVSVPVAVGGGDGDGGTVGDGSGDGDGGGSGQASVQGGGDVASVKARIAALYRQAEQLTQAYDAAQEQAGKLTLAVQHSQAELELGRREYTRQQASLGRMAGAEYRASGVDKDLQLMLSERPDSFLGDAALADRLSEDESSRVSTVIDRQRALIQLQRTATDQLAELAATRLRATQARKDVAAQLREAQSLLNTLSPTQRRAVAASDEGTDGSGGAPLTIPPADLSALPPSSRARTAIQAAFADLGKPYIYGAEGPDAFDCSGLMQRIWRQAGVELPRTSSEQAQAGQRVPVSDIQPGDMVIYYAGRNHIGIYIGDGQIIHAPHPGSDVRISPLNSMPVNMVVRV